MYVINNRFLNDDCLLKKLSFLTISELNSTVLVSKQFQEMSKYTVKMNHREVNLRNEYRQIHLNQFETLLENFSNFMTILSIDINIFPAYNIDREKKIIELLAQHFNNNIMHRSHTIYLDYFKKLELIDLIELLSVIRTISNFKLNQVDIPELLTHLKHLNELTITNCRPSGPIFMTVYEPKDFSTSITKLDLRGNEHLLIY